VNRTFRFVLSAVPSLFAAASLCAAPAALDDVLKRMERAEKEVKTLSFRFTQTAHLLVTDEKQQIKGEAHFKRPDKFRVEHAVPRKQIVVSDGETLWLYNPAQEQVVVDSWKNWAESAGFPKGLTPFQMNPADMQKRYRFTLEDTVGSGKERRSVLRLEPIDPGPWPYKIRLWIDEAGLPARTELESQSVKTVTQISNVKINPPLKDALFVFAPPRGVDVLKPPFR
jgi:outer membrane lipoprotein carrier protein